MKKRKNLPLILAVVICVVSVILMCVALGVQREEVVTFSPPPFEEGAQSGVPSVPPQLGWSEVDAKFYRASLCGVVKVVDGTADIWLTNPEHNDVWLRLRILSADGAVLAETGLICPGEYLQAITFDTVPESGQAISMKLMAYEPETYYSAGSVVLNTTVS